MQTIFHIINTKTGSIEGHNQLSIFRFWPIQISKHAYLHTIQTSTPGQLIDDNTDNKEGISEGSKRNN